MRQFWYILFFLATPIVSYTQDFSPDSLLKILPSLKAGDRVDCLNKLSENYFWLKNDSAGLFARQAYEEAVAIQYQRGIDISWYIRGSLKIFEGRDAEAEVLLRKALRTLKGHEHYYTAWTLLHLGFTLYNEAKYTEGIQLMESSVPLMKAYDKADGLGKSYTLLSLAYGAIGDYEKALENAQAGYMDRMRTGYVIGTAYSLRVLGKIYNLVSDYQTSLQYYYQSIPMFLTRMVPVTDYAELAVIYGTIGQFDSAHKYMAKAIDLAPQHPYVLLYSGELDMLEHKCNQALPKLLRCLSGFRQNNCRNIIMRNLIDIGKSYVETKQYSLAYKYAKEAFDMSAETGARPRLRDSYGLLSEVFRCLGNIDSAYHYLQTYATLKDDVMNDQFKGKIFALKNKVENQKKQAAIALLNNENILNDQRLKKEALKAKILIVSIAVILLLGFFIFRNIILSRKNVNLEAEQLKNNLQVQQMEAVGRQLEFQQKAEQLEMKALRAQMNPHFIFNCLSSVNRFILINEREAASDYLTKFSRLIRMALQHSEKTLITLEIELEMLRLYLELERLRFKNTFDYTISFVNTIDVSTIFIPPLLMQPFAENAIWHGLMHKSGNGHLDISLSIDDKILNCVIADDGIGRQQAALHKSKSAQKNKSMGVQITTERLNIFNHQSGENTSISIEDVLDDRGRLSGTKVLLKVQYRSLTEAFE